MPDDCAINDGNERNGEIPGFSQRIDDVLLGVTRMWRMEKSGNDDSLNCQDVFCQFVSDF